LTFLIKYPLSTETAPVKGKGTFPSSLPWEKTILDGNEGRGERETDENGDETGRKVSVG
jgi:hypothetical protein